MGAFKESLSLKNMMKILLILVILTCLALGDFSAEDKTDVAVDSGGDLLHHSLVRRDARKRKPGHRRRKAKGRKKRKEEKEKKGGQKNPTGRRKKGSKGEVKKNRK